MTTTEIHLQLASDAKNLTRALALERGINGVSTRTHMNPSLTMALDALVIELAEWGYAPSD